MSTAYDTIPYKLPHECVAILARLELQDRQRSSDARARRAQIREIRAQEVSLRQDRRRYQDFVYFPGRNPAHGDKDDSIVKPSTANANAQIKQIDERLRRLRLQREKLEATTEAPALTYGRVVSELHRYVAEGRELFTAEPPTISPESEANLKESLVHCREKIAKLKSQRKRIANAALPATAAKKAAKEQIKRLAAQGQPKVMGLFTGGQIEWPRKPTATAAGRYIDQPIDSAALLVYLMQDALLERIDEMIDFDSGAFATALPPAERKKQMQAIDAELDQTERLEAAIVERLIEKGSEAEHRPDISILAVFSLNII